MSNIVKDYLLEADGFGADYFARNQARAGQNQSIIVPSTLGTLILPLSRSGR